MADPVVPLVDVLEGVEEPDAVLVGPEHSLSFVTAGGNMIHSAGMFYAQGAGHEGRISEEIRKIKHSMPDLRVLRDMASRTSDLLSWYSGIVAPQTHRTASPGFG
jgi:hypothetical protein